MPGILNRITKPFTAAAAAVILATAAYSPASAQLSAPRTAATLEAAIAADAAPVVRVGHRRYRDNAGAIIAGSIIGLATGVIAQDIFRGRYYDPYYTPAQYYRPHRPRRPYYAPPPPPPRWHRPRRNNYRARFEPWTPAWYRYCSRRYRTFNPSTGYYIARPGQYRFCR